MKNTRIIMLALAVTAIVLTACGPGSAGPASTSASQTPAPANTGAIIMSSTPDPCSIANLPAEVQKVDDITRQFDDGTAIVDNLLRGSSLNADQLANYVTQLQSMRRTADDQTVPACLKNLKDIQLADMNAVIDYFLLILGHSDKKTTDQVAAQAIQLDQQYKIEKARLLGVLTIIPDTATAGTPAAKTTATPTKKP